MNEIIIISNFMGSVVWISLGFVLLFIKVIPHPLNHLYQTAKRYMALFLITCGLSIYIGFSIGKFHNERIEILNIFSILSFFTSTIFLVLSLKSLYNSERLIRRSIIKIFSPIFFLIIIYVIVYFIYGDINVYSVNEYFSYINHSPVLIIRTLMFITILIYILLMILKYLKIRREYLLTINNYFSGNECDRVLWIHRLFYYMLVLGLVVIPSYIFSSPYLDIIITCSLTILSIVLTVKYINYQQLFNIVYPAIEFAKELEQTNPEETGDNYNSFKFSLLVDKWINRPDKPYLKERISINDVAIMIGISKRNLSDYINKKYNMNFNTWINTFRIDEIVRMLSDESCIKSLTEIADNTGFSDLPTMSKVFKKIKGISPSEYRMSSKK